MKIQGMKLTLLNRDGSRAGILEWDEDAGTLSGELADEALEIISRVVRDGSVSVHPRPNQISIRDPLHDRREMAAVLDLYWRVPELARYYPAGPSGGGLPEGAEH